MSQIREIVDAYGHDNTKVVSFLKSIDNMEMTEENIRKLTDLVLECKTIRNEANTEDYNKWTDHPTLRGEDSYYIESLKLQAKAARAEAVANQIIWRVEEKASPEMFNAFCEIIDSEQKQEGKLRK